MYVETLLPASLTRYARGIFICRRSAELAIPFSFEKAGQNIIANKILDVSPFLFETLAMFEAV